MRVFETVLLLGLLILNLISFCQMRSDKRRAQRGMRRIPERTLFLAAGCFGALGGTVGMYVFHHKKKKMKFVLLFPMMLLLQVAILGFAVYKFWR